MKNRHLAVEQRHSLRTFSLVVLATCLLFAGTSVAQIDMVQTLTVGRPVVAGAPPATQSFIVDAPPSPAAVVILLPGLNGDIKLTPVGPSGGTLDVTSDNFLVRARALLASQGFYVITLDCATDFQQLPSCLDNQQGSAAHIQDVLQVIAWARTAEPGLPVWLVGTSRGTAGAFVAAQNNPASGGPDGLLFAAPNNDAAATDPDSVLAANLAAITVPTYIVINKLDTCAKTLPSADAAVVKQLTSSPAKALVLVQGGFPPLTADCFPLSYHGFFGIEDLAVHTIALRIGSTATALASSLNPSTVSASVTFTATVTYLARSGTPTGTVKFKDLTTATLLGSAPLVAGVATFSTSTLGVGNHSIVATYGGDGSSTMSMSTKLVQQVN